MATNELKKSVKIEVDTKDVNKALKSLREMVKGLKQFSDTNQEILKFFNAQAAAQEKATKASRKYTASIKERVEKLKEENKLKKELAELENPAPKSIKSQTRSERFSTFKKMASGGLGGYYQRLIDESERQTQTKVAGYDEEIAALQIQKSRYKSPNGKKAKELQGQIEDLQRKRSQTIGEGKTQANKYAAAAAAAQKVVGAFNGIALAVKNFVLAPFKQLYEGVMGAVTAMVDFKSGVATFGTSTSLITNATAREQQLKYGLSASQNYAFTQAKSMLGINTDEDLMYMNPEQRERLLAYMEKYSEWYDELESSGVLQDIQEMQLEFEELKQEIAMEFLQWLAANKETIMTSVKGIFEVVKTIAHVVTTVLDFLTGTFGFGKGSSWDLYDSASDSINNTNNSKNTQINMNINTTNNATGVLGSQEALNQFQEENWNKLAKEVVTAIGG